MKPIKTSDGKTRVYPDNADVDKSVGTSVRWRKTIKLFKNNKLTEILRAWK